MALEGSIIVGLVAGWIAGMTIKGSSYGIVGDMIMGLVGGLVGGLLGSLVGISAFQVVAPLFGAAILIVFMRAAPGRTSLS